MSLPLPVAVTKIRVIDSPIGPLTLHGFDETLTRLDMHHERHAAPLPRDAERDDLAFGDAVDQLNAYFAGRLTTFDVRMQLVGTDFQKKVWSELCNIPYGETITYAEQAWRAGSPRASRAVGAANGRNPIAIIVPCHRVIGSNNKLTGFGGGLDRKEWLLNHERFHA